MDSQNDTTAETLTSSTEASESSTSGLGMAGWVAGIGTAVAFAMRRGIARADAAEDIPTLNALLSAEYNAIQAYTAGAGVLSAPPSGDPLAAAAPTVLAVAVHFQSQHRDHANALAAVITAAGGTPVAESSVMFTPPSGFTGTVTNVIKLAANAEKAASIAYAEVQKTLTTQMNAALVAAIGANETQHFTVLSLLAEGQITATAATMAMATDVVPVAFVTAQNSESGLESIPDFTFSDPSA